MHMYKNIEQIRSVRSPEKERVVSRGIVASQALVDEMTQDLTELSRVLVIKVALEAKKVKYLCVSPIGVSKLCTYVHAPVSMCSSPRFARSLDDILAAFQESCPVHTAYRIRAKQGSHRC